MINMATNLRVNSDSYKWTWTLHSFESTRTNKHGLVLVLVYLWMGPYTVTRKWVGSSVHVCSNAWTAAVTLAEPTHPSVRRQPTDHSHTLHSTHERRSHVQTNARPRTSTHRRMTQRGDQYTHTNYLQWGRKRTDFSANIRTAMLTYKQVQSTIQLVRSERWLLISLT